MSTAPPRFEVHEVAALHMVNRRDFGDFQTVRLQTIGYDGEVLAEIVLFSREQLTVIDEGGVTRITPANLNPEEPPL